MSDRTSIRRFMTSSVITVRPDTPLAEAVDILIARGFNGLPVVDEGGLLVGLLTEHDLLIKGSSVHVPTLLKLMSEFHVYKKDRSIIQPEIERLLSLKVKDAMNREPLTLTMNDTVEDVSRAFLEHHRINPIPIVDENHRLAGIISRHDLVKLFRAPSVAVDGKHDQRKVDSAVTKFLFDFERQTLLVSSSRAQLWIYLGIVLVVVGFLVALALFSPSSSLAPIPQ